MNTTQPITVDETTTEWFVRAWLPYSIKCNPNNSCSGSNNKENLRNFKPYFDVDLIVICSINKPIHPIKSSTTGTIEWDIIPACSVSIDGDLISSLDTIEGVHLRIEKSCPSGIVDSSIKHIIQTVWTTIIRTTILVKKVIDRANRNFIQSDSIDGTITYIKFRCRYTTNLVEKGNKRTDADLGVRYGSKIGPK